MVRQDRARVCVRVRVRVRVRARVRARVFVRVSLYGKNCEPRSADPPRSG